MILLEQLEVVGRSYPISLEDPKASEVATLIDTLIETGSPITPADLGESDFLSGSWKLIFTTDLAAAMSRILPKQTPPLQFARGVQVFLDVSERSGKPSGTLEQRVIQAGKPVVRAQAEYIIDRDGGLSYSFDQIYLTIFGTEVPLPVLGDYRNSYIATSYFDGRLWVERTQRMPDKTGTSPKYNVFKFVEAKTEP